MTPAARVAAAIEVLDAIGGGLAPEPALARWARGNRFAGSRDREALRDLVFDALRRRRSYAALGGGTQGRALMLGALRAAEANPDATFSGVGYAPAPLDPDERARGRPPAKGAEALDCPDWLFPRLEAALGPRTEAVLAALRQRAPVHLRVNLARTNRDAAAAALAAEGVHTRPHSLSPSALEVVEGARRLRGAAALADGRVELQDAASQAVSDAVPLAPGARMLDLCAGGGGKTLAVAARVPGRFFAHDSDPARLRDLPRRAQRAGVEVTCLPGDRLEACAPFDLVLVDAPCSGSGAWRRNPHGKWQLDAGTLADHCALQDRLLAQAATLAVPGGPVVYVTCSVLAEENAARRDAFLATHDGWRCVSSRQFLPMDGGDGFFVAILTSPVHPTDA